MIRIERIAGERSEPTDEWSQKKAGSKPAFDDEAHSACL